MARAVGRFGYCSAAQQQVSECERVDKDHGIVHKLSRTTTMTQVAVSQVPQSCSLWQVHTSSYQSFLPCIVGKSHVQPCGAQPVLAREIRSLSSSFSYTPVPGNVLELVSLHGRFKTSACCVDFMGWHAPG